MFGPKHLPSCGSTQGGPIRETEPLSPLDPDETRLGRRRTSTVSLFCTVLHPLSVKYISIGFINGTLYSKVFPRSPSLLFIKYLDVVSVNPTSQNTGCLVYVCGESGVSNTDFSNWVRHKGLQQSSEEFKTRHRGGHNTSVDSLQPSPTSVDLRPDPGCSRRGF